MILQVGTNICTCFGLFVDRTNLADPEAIQATITVALDSCGRRKIIFNNAGMEVVVLLHGTTLESSRLELIPTAFADP